ncbi:FAD-linked oxidoreductase-like protein [Podospora australis]|uniref:Proline dehydrogenase n=1 Tax=Podospora australis TaxID=1536484 RepID=A0AAN6WTY7_9PEZI|nr:FAD-linked oxidoreductase-like protein [Podospora australis]
MTLTKEEIDEFYRNSRLSIPTGLRLPMASLLSFGTGFLLGAGHGSRTAGLQFRAEHAHKLPTTTTGWYLYHKSKNYRAARGGVKEGLKMGFKISFWTTAMLAIEHMFDTYRGAPDMFNTITSLVTVAGGFSLWNRFSLPMAARTTKAALVVGTLYGGAQDFMSTLHGRKLPYASSATSTTTTRSLHSSSTQSSPSGNLTLEDAADFSPESTTATMPPPTTPSPLSVLPLTNVLRSWMTTAVSSSPVLLPPSLAAMSVLAHTSSPVLNPDRNPLLHSFLKKTFYAQFCAGEHPAEVQKTIKSLKDIGFSGVILGYAREVVLTEAQTKQLSAASLVDEECINNEVRPWATGTLMTVLLAEPGDFVALKFTGAGRQALFALKERPGEAPPQQLGEAIDTICELAQKRGVRLLFDAEQNAVQRGIDEWTMRYMRKYNTGGKAVIYNTYQAYLKSTGETLSRHLKEAREKGFTLGVKLVRGAYLGSDPRDIIHDTKEGTDRAYDGIAEGLLKKEWSFPLQGEGGFPDMAVVLATHNRDSVLKAKRLIADGTAREEVDVAFAQLQGMADEVSCELVAGNHREEKKKMSAYKYLVWGSTGECMKYLLRRAYENRDAVQRTVSGREAMKSEVVRRVKGLFGLA